MQYGTMRSMALAPTQTALGPLERQAAVCCLLSAMWGQFALGVFLSLWGKKGWHTGRRIKYEWKGRVDVVFRDEVRKPR